MVEEIRDTPYYRALLSQSVSPESILAMRKGLKKLIAFTNEKLFIVAKGFGIGGFFFGMPTQAYALASISDVTLISGILSSSIEITLGGEPSNPNAIQTIERIRFASNQFDQWQLFAQQLKRQSHQLRNQTRPMNAGANNPPIAPPPAPRNPHDILRERFARGEISEEEYRRRMHVLQN